VEDDEVSGSRLRGFLTVVMLSAVVLASCTPAAPPAPVKPAESKPAESKPAPPAPAAPAAAPAAPAAAPAASSAAAAKPTENKPAGASAAGPALEKLTIGTNIMPRNLDPSFDTSAISQEIYRRYLDPLVTIGDDGEPAAALATKWAMNPDSSWRIELRPGVKFHDGTPLTSTDVKFTIERILDPNVKATWKPRIALIEAVDTPDPQTVVVKTKSPFATLMKNLATIYILPSKLHQEKGEDAFMTPPVGTGMYRFKEWAPESSITFERNEDYWGTKPNAKTLVYRLMPEASTRVAALQAGEVDAIYDLPTEQIDPLKQKGFEVAAVPLGYSMVVALKSTMGGPLEKQEVRQALNYAVDKESLVKALFGEYAKVLDGQLLGPDGFGYSPKLKPYPYDPKKARELLTQAGYPNGFEINLILSPGQYPKDKEIADLVAAQLKEVGVTVKPTVMERAVKSARGGDGTLDPMFMISWQYLPTMDAEAPYSIHVSNSSWKIMADPKFDELYTEQAKTSDPKARQAILQQMTERTHEVAPALFLYQTTAIYGVSPKISGLAGKPDYTLDLSKVAAK
jgi:peptide/nickel transport system substrate-binding protein